MIVEPLAVPPDATVRVPGSKSLTNRALVCAAFATGTSTIENGLVADDTEAMLVALAELGIDVRRDGTTLVVEGSGGAVPAGPVHLDARLSGTTARFLAPVLATGVGPYRLDGLGPLRARPMGPVIEALRALGTDVVEEVEPEHLPLTISGAARGGRVEIAGHVSSQFLSGLLLAGPLFPDGVSVHLTTPLVSLPYVELTRSVMRAFGATVDATSVEPGGYAATTYRVEPDASAASYFFAAAAITGGRVTVEGLGASALQGDVAFLDLLERMGAAVDRAPSSITVTGGGGLHGITADLSDLSDTVQTLAAVAVFADSPTTITGVDFIRRKETDRIAHTVANLRRCGIEASEEEDGLTVHPGMPHAARIETHDDHRMAMSFALLGLRIPGVDILDPDCVAKTYPGYFADLEQLRRVGGG
ncbi:MAG TPA: 3-phosphoshikimate 1-carboxyvinyltransferase [Acidimicrobiales bacterium]|nr:3-phosphoshikimate 1-carboxyvinyltransferase [Acidimicrobiales bacterium]